MYDVAHVLLSLVLCAYLTGPCGKHILLGMNESRVKAFQR